MNQKLLIVEDDCALRNLLKGLFLAEGYQVRTAANGQEALRRLAQEPVQLVVTDLEMPLMDGYQLIHLLGMRPPCSAAPLILVFSGEADLRQKLAAFLERGAITGYLAKPTEPEVLLATVHRFLSHKEEARSFQKEAGEWSSGQQEQDMSWTRRRSLAFAWEAS